MATRPRTSSGNKKKNPIPESLGNEADDGETVREPPTLNDVVEESASEEQPLGMESEPVAEVTGSNLEQREIPSFSISREARIAEAAYWRAERRGFAPGHELDDWLEAERAIDGTDGEERSSPEYD